MVYNRYRTKPYNSPEFREQYVQETRDENDKQETTNSKNVNEDKSIPKEPEIELAIVQDILACKYYGGKRVYKVKWEDSPKTTWEYGENLPQFMIRDFHVRKTYAGKVKRKHKRT